MGPFGEGAGVGIGEHAADGRCVDGAGTDAVDPDAISGMVDGQAAGEVDDGSLAGAVDDVAGVAGEPRDGRRRHDRPAAALDHRRDGVVGTEEHRANVDRHHEVPILLRQLDGGTGTDRAGVVEQRVEAAERLDRRGDHPLGVGCVGDIGDAGGGDPARLLDHRDGLLDPGAAQVSGDNRRALLGEAHRAGPADARPGTGDDGDLSPKQHPGILAARPA